MQKKKLFQRMMNNQKNIGFNDFTLMTKSFGFSLDRVDGSHQIYKRNDVEELLNIQNNKGKAKPYQVKYFLFLVEKYNLLLED